MMQLGTGKPGAVRVLVVDDNDATRYATSRVLRSVGATVIEAIDGAGALARAPEADLILLDVNLPDIDGFEVCRRLRGDPRTLTTPIAHVSAQAMRDSDRVAGLDSGADAYLTHPVAPEVLVATLNALLRAHQADLRRLRSESAMRAIVDHAHSGIAMISTDGRLTAVNPAFCEMFGRSEASLVGQPLDAIGMPQFVDGLRALLGGMPQSTWRGVMTIPAGEADIRHFECRVARSVGGEFVALVSDATTRRQLEIEREVLLANESAARAEAEAASMLKDRFLAMVSHELRNPLNAILGWAQLMKRNPAAKVLGEGVTAIMRNVDVQVKLVDDLLDVSRISSGKIRLERTSVDPAGTLHDVLFSLQAAADERGIRLESDVGRGLVVDADPARLQQIFWNLVANAIKFSADGGVVRTTLARDGDHVVLVVDDDGAGIAAEFLPHVFDQFRQADATLTRSAGGLGLGLAIVRSLVTMHGGHVAAHSAGLGHGARFIVTLPSVERVARDVAPAPAAGAEPSPLADARILVVEDSAETRRLVATALIAAGARVIEADGAPAALAALATQRIALIASDIAMPGVDGYALMREVRARGHAMPAIALTALGQERDAQAALDAGFSTHLRKPVDFDRLVHTALQLIGRA